MNKKIALISPHHSPNYGTMLQAYALAKTIKNLGYDVEYISYDNFIKRSLFQKLWYYLWHPKKLVNKFIQKRTKNNLDDYSFFRTAEFETTMNEFEEFYQKHIPYSSKRYNPKTIHTISGYSTYIVGSDQTWSPHLYTSTSINFLDFVKDNTLKNAYAPSLGTIDIPKTFQHILEEKISSFANLSCREKTNCQLIEDLTGLKVTQVLDPTLLLTPEQWDKIAKPVNMPEKYILCYILGEKECISDFADLLGKKKGIPVYYIAIRPIYLQKENSLKDIGPSQLITLIKNASYVVTDSFHGTIFSINYNRNFYSFDKRQQEADFNDNGRILEVLKDFRISNRYKADSDQKFEEDGTFDTPNEILKQRRMESVNYLKQIINSAHSK